MPPFATLFVAFGCAWAAKYRLRAKRPGLSLSAANQPERCWPRAFALHQTVFRDQQLAMRLSAAACVAVLCCTALVCLAAADKPAAAAVNSKGNGLTTAQEQLFSQLEAAAAAGDLDRALAVQKQLLRISRKQDSQRRKLMQPSTISVSWLLLFVYFNFYLAAVWL